MIWEIQCGVSGTNNCISLPCYNGATCISFNGGYQCQCRYRYSGQHCEFGLFQFTTAIFKLYFKVVHMFCLIGEIILYIMIIGHCHVDGPLLNKIHLIKNSLKT